MSIYRNVHISFWEDTKVQDDMTSEDRYFMLYLLTNTHTNQVGCFEISKRQMSNETGYNIETIDKLLQRFEDNLKIIRYSNESKEIIILNWYKYNWTSSPKVRKCIEREKKKIKDKSFLKYIDTVCIPYAYGIHTETQEEQEKEQEQEKEGEQEQAREEEKEQLDSCVDAVVDFFEKNIGPITPYSFEVLKGFEKEMGTELVILAMKKAVEKNARNISYIKSILNNWSKKGVKSVLEAEEENIKFKSRQNRQNETEEERQARKTKELEEAIANDDS